MDGIKQDNKARCQTDRKASYVYNRIDFVSPETPQRELEMAL
jgi:hypothetical protein